MANILFLALGGGLGTLFRFGIYTATHETFVHHFPWGTTVVNLLGAFFMGLAWGLVGEKAIPSGARLFLFTGFFGGFTTFSAFVLESASLLNDGKPGLAVMNVLLANTAGLLLVFAGLALAKIATKSML